MTHASGSYGYVVVRSDWVLHEAVQLLLNLSRNDVAQARAAGYHMFEVRILNDNSIAGLLAEIEIPKRDRNGDVSRMIRAQVLIPWQKIDALVTFSQEEFGEVKRGIGFHAQPE
jgi:hypothetical protein